MNSARAWRAGLLAFSSLLLAACGKEDEARDAKANDIIETKDGRADAIWLRASDHVDPAQWMASREAGHEVDMSDDAVGKLRDALIAARPHFLESQRMLANRTAQIGKMLADEGKAEDYASIMSALTNVAKAAVQRQAYGELCHHYFNLRHMNMSREAALGVLGRRYETQKQFR